MSRHLMARFRHLAAERYDWQHGRPLAWSEWASDNPEKGRSPFGGRLHHTDDHVSAIVHHGEQRYGLEVMPSDTSDGEWSWGIHEYRNQRSPLWDWPDVEPEYLGEHLNWTSPGEWDHPKGTPAKYYGTASSPAEAMKFAQDNWETHKAHVEAQNPIRGGGYDINQIMRDEGF